MYNLYHVWYRTRLSSRLLGTEWTSVLWRDDLPSNKQVKCTIPSPKPLDLCCSPLWRTQQPTSLTTDFQCSQLQLDHLQICEGEIKTNFSMSKLYEEKSQWKRQAINQRLLVCLSCAMFVCPSDSQRAARHVCQLECDRIWNRTGDLDTAPRLPLWILSLYRARPHWLMRVFTTK